MGKSTTTRELRELKVLLRRVKSNLEYRNPRDGESQDILQQVHQYEQKMDHIITVVRRHWSDQ